MIKKFIKISGTGKFLNYNPNSVPGVYRTNEFEKINLIYGENGIGKTTLSIVLRSLKGDNNLLLKKRSFNKTQPQEIEVLTDIVANPKLTYSNNKWNFHYPNIETFDIHFINDNIYTGSGIETIHKKNLFEVIFGKQGIKIKTDIQKIKDEIKTGTKDIKHTAEKIELAIGNTFTAENYCNVEIDKLIETKITKKVAEITTAKGYQLIKQKKLLKTIPLLLYPFDIERGIRCLEKSNDNISEDFLTKFKAHKDHLEIEEAEDWLKKGFDAIRDKSCPFCLRPFTKTVEIIEAYNQYFNVEYNLLLKSIQEISSKSGQYSLDAQFFKIENGILYNNSLIEFWKKYLTNEPLQFSATKAKFDIIEEFQNVKAVIKSKIQNPIKSQNSSLLLSLSSKILAINKMVGSYNTDVLNYNTRINTLKDSSQANLNQLEIELYQLEAVKKRKDPTISSHCEKYLTSKQNVKSLKIQKEEKQKLLDIHSSKIFINYSTKINQYLRIFAPYLEIRGLDSVYVGSSTEPIVNYALHINGNEIKQENSLTNPTFKYSLSEGDKSALALAFFLSKLEVDGNIHDKIIVFDDPVSSFDLNRKSTTISKLLHFAQQAKQLFVLTHNIIFAGDFWRRANQLSLSCQSSKIDFIGTSSAIVEFHIDNETLSSVLKDSLAIKKYLVKGCFTDQERRDIARCLRPALESYFHLKFFDVVKPNEWLGNFIDKIRNSKAGDPYFRLMGEVQEMSDLNDYSKKYHHRFNTNADSEQVSDTELRSYCERTLNLIQII